MSSDSLLDRIAGIQDMGEKWVYLLIIIGVIVPTLVPLNMPVAISEPTRAVYNYINALEPGSIVIFAVDLHPVTMPECFGAMMAVMQHIFSLADVRIIATTRGTMGSDILMMGMNTVYGGLNVPGKEYGVDYIVMPYIPGGETYVAQLAQDPQSMYTQDYFYNFVEDLPLFQEFQNGADIDLIVEFCHGPQFYDYLRHFNAAYGTPIAISVVAYIYAEVMPYYATGQFIGYMVGLRGAGEYEKIVGKPGIALQGADALSGSYAWIIAVIIIGNIANLLKKTSGGGN